MSKASAGSWLAWVRTVSLRASRPGVSSVGSDRVCARLISGTGAPGATLANLFRRSNNTSWLGGTGAPGDGRASSRGEVGPSVMNSSSESVPYPGGGRLPRPSQGTSGLMGVCRRSFGGGPAAPGSLAVSVPTAVSTAAPTAASTIRLVRAPSRAESCCTSSKILLESSMSDDCRSRISARRRTRSAASAASASSLLKQGPMARGA
mmetsp:Transcript_7372/g.16827  ORF Transcript_7372/g.16827 Transcript_7372/m.16827 type:complete len:206 (-) Transcript_7372:41-658(-)